MLAWKFRYVLINTQDTDESYAQINFLLTIVLRRVVWQNFTTFWAGYTASNFKVEK
jgi:hypothetical protein